MKVAVIINPKAGQVNVDFIVNKIKKALFRCYLDFFYEHNAEGLRSFIEDQLQMEVDYLVLVGGDGTINLVANIASELRNQGYKIPPICLVSSGTANDLAYELGVDMRIDRAVHSIFSGETEVVDLLKVESSEKVSYMFTNGGVGLTANTAKAVNNLRDGLRKSMNSTNLLRSLGSKFAGKTIEALGPNIYNLMLLRKWATWKKDWEVRIETDDGFSLVTESPFVLVNNQKTLARRFHTAPATDNSDGKFSVLILNQTRSWEQIRNVVDLGQGRWIQSKDLISKEVQEIKIRSLSASSPLSFIGDGEILQENVDEITVRCVHPGLKMVVDRGGKS